MSALAHQKYQQNQVNTASPGELTLMLYKGALRFINASITAVEKKNIEDASNFNLRAQDIIRELMVTLNFDYALSKQLVSLYDYMLRRLIEANVKKDTEILIEVRGFCEELATTWAEAMKLAKKTG